MHFDLTDEQHEMQRVARDLLRERAPSPGGGAGDGYDAALWAELCDLGWAGIGIEERYGGLGLGSVEAAVLSEQAGYALARCPLLSTIAAGFVIAEAGAAPQRARWLPALATGAATATVGVARDGVAELVADADAADVIVLVEGNRAQLVERVDADVSPLDTIDGTRGYARVAGAGEPLPGDPGRGRLRATAALSAELVGVCQRALDMTVGFVKTRVQFDRPVGAFQAVAHRCADMLIATQGARSTAYHAAWACDDARTADGLRERAVSVAKAVSADAGREVTASAFTWEADVHWLYKRAQLDMQLFGSASAHRLLLADHLRRDAVGWSA
jgi:alkylation response protein AidB-like acyl-CoA dehydrogenase